VWKPQRKCINIIDVDVDVDVTVTGSEGVVCIHLAQIIDQSADPIQGCKNN
jgi:hypothetical protein